MLDVKITTGADGLHNPAVTVLNPIGRRHAKLPVVAAGDDQLIDAGPIPIGQRYLGVGRGVGESMAAGSPVEFGNEFPGGASMIESVPWERSCCHAVNTCSVMVEVADVDSLVVQVEADGPGFAVAEREGGGGFGRVGEPQQLGEPDRAMAGLEVAEHPASTDRGKLLVITDEPDTAAPINDVGNSGVQRDGVGHAGFVDQHERGRPDTGCPPW